MTPVKMIFRREIKTSFRYRKRGDGKKVLEYHGISLELSHLRDGKKRVIFEMRFKPYEVIPILRYVSPDSMYEGHDPNSYGLYEGMAADKIAQNFLKVVDRHGYIYDTRPRSISSDIWNDLNRYFMEVFGNAPQQK